VLTAVKDQGQCGSCWAHAATESIETHVAIATGNLCNGAIAELAFDYVKTTGIAQEWTDPLHQVLGRDAGLRDACVPGGEHLRLHGGRAQRRERRRRGRRPRRPAVDASSWNDYETGIFSGCSYAKDISMDHAVQAVGYGHDYESGMDYWIVRNSWNAGWGEAGFIRLFRNVASTACGWNVDPANGDGCKGQTAPEWACGMCGIAYDTLYPNYAPLSN
jgi:cathepsin L